MNTHVLMGALLAAVLLGGCQKASAPAVADKPAVANDAPAAADAKGGAGDKAAEPGEGVTLSAEQREKIGLATAPAKTVDYTEEVGGYGAVIAHETLATAAAELVTADATAKQSRSALARSKRLANTPGALSTDVEETNQRQAAVDEAALTLAKQRLSATFGQSPPWRDDANSPLLRQLAGGVVKLVRVTFPLGSLQGQAPKSLRATHIGPQGEPGWDMSPVWPAPADANVPGRGFFAVLRDSDAGEGERLLVFAPIGTAQSGILIPASAAVISDAKYWCYLERRPGVFMRVAISVDKPYRGGYFVTDGVTAGEAIVTTGAGLLLAQESNSGPGAD